MPKKWSMSHPQTSSIKDPPTLGVSVARFHRRCRRKGIHHVVQVAWGQMFGILQEAREPKAYSQHFRAEGCHRYFNRGQTSMGCLEKLHGFPCGCCPQVENIKSPLPVYQLLHIPLGLFFGSLPCNFSVSSPAWILLSMG